MPARLGSAFIKATLGLAPFFCWITLALTGRVVYGSTTRGISFVVDSKGNKTAALINLRRFRKLWEDFYDLALVASRANEPRESFDVVERRLRRKAKRVQS